MAIPGWTQDQSPFHEGERAIQTRLGVEDRMDRQGRRIIREFLPDQHRQFYHQLSYVIVGTVDQSGHPWASILVGQSGFISSPDGRTLHLQAQVLPGDPLSQNLVEGCDIGLLGIELHTRRRNRINGVVTAIGSDRIEIQVRQAFGNCPQYIQSRTLQAQPVTAHSAKTVQTMTTLSEPARKIIAAADTFFIATAYQSASAGSASGVDVSHRGGKPGFVRIDNPSQALLAQNPSHQNPSNRHHSNQNYASHQGANHQEKNTLTIPDFSGNLHFNTFGNIELNPRAGLIFIDFEQGDILYLTGAAEVIWDGPEISTYEGAERLLKFYVDNGVMVPGSLPLQWSGPEFSPFLDHTGPWLT